MDLIHNGLWIYIYIYKLQCIQQIVNVWFSVRKTFELAIIIWRWVRFVYHVCIFVLHSDDFASWFSFSSTLPSLASIPYGRFHNWFDSLTTDVQITCGSLFSWKRNFLSNSWQQSSYNVHVHTLLLWASLLLWRTNLALRDTFLTHSR